MASRFAERLEILLAVGRDLVTRTGEFRREIGAANLADLHISDKIAKHLDKFPDKTIKEKDVGYQEFQENAAKLLERWAPLYDLVISISEFRDAALQLIGEMSERIVKLDMAMNVLPFRRYFELFMVIAKLQLLLSILSEQRGRTLLAAYCTAHMLLRHSYPTTLQPVFQFLADYQHPVRRLQDDFAKARLRVDCLVPLAPQLRLLCDPAALRKEVESCLSPIAEKKGGKGAAASMSSERRPSMSGVDDPIDAPLAYLGEVKQWVAYGMLLSPEGLGEEGAIELLLTVLNTMYVMPVHGADVLWPHTEFEAVLKGWDSKTSLRILKKKEEAKRLKTGLGESRIAAFRNSAAAHLAVRTALCTKLSHLQHVLTDAPDLLFAKLPKLLCALRLTQDEIQWWALHHHAVPDEVPKKVREEVASRDDPNAWAPVMTMIRYSMALKELVRKEHGRLTQSAQDQLADECRMGVEALVNSAPHDKFPNAGCAHVSQLLRDMPAHLSAAADVGCDLRGLRLNVLRLMCDLSCAGAFGIVQGNPTMATLMHELQAAATLSEGIDALEPLLSDATHTQALLADNEKLKLLFQGGLEHNPAACVAMTQLAASGSPTPGPTVHGLLGLLEARLTQLLRAVAQHMNARRTATAPPAGLSHHQALHRLTMMLAALDKAPPLELSGQRLHLREWVREKMELAIERVASMIFFSSNGELVPPTVSICQLYDWSNALASIRYFTSIDVHAILNAALARELGLCDTQVAASAPLPQGEIPLRSEGIDLGTASEGATSKKAGAPLLIDRVIEWYQRAVSSAAENTAGATYAPGRRAFGSGSVLDSIQFAALSKLIGAAGTTRLHGMLIKLAGTHAAKVRAMLQTNAQELGRFMEHFDKRHELLQVQLAGMPDGLAHARALGVVLAVRKLLLVGVKQAKTELFAAPVSSFVKGLGDQQLPDGQRAADGQLHVAELLAAYGLAGSQTTEPPLASQTSTPPKDALLEKELDAQCGISTDAKLWALLPYALGMGFAFDGFWGGAAPQLAADTISGNIHALGHAYHGLLGAVEPHIPKPKSAVSGAKLAHRCFLHVSSLVLLQLRTAVQSNGQLKPADVTRAERSQASMVLVIEQLVQTSGCLTYGDLESVLPTPLIGASYSGELTLTKRPMEDAVAPPPESPLRSSGQEAAAQSSFRDG